MLVLFIFSIECQDDKINKDKDPGQSVYVTIYKVERFLLLLLAKA